MTQRQPAATSRSCAGRSPTTSVPEVLRRLHREVLPHRGEGDAVRRHGLLVPGPGGVDPYKPVPVEDRNDYYVKSAAKAGGFKVLGEPMGNVQTQDMGHFKDSKWKGNDQLWWTGAKPGDKLELAVPVKKTGKYESALVLTKARDYGIVQLYARRQEGSASRSTSTTPT